jgi:hydrogenase nickel incorporation protein HypB
MCNFCGCSDPRETLITNLQSGRHVHLHADGGEHVHSAHTHTHDHSHQHSDHAHSPGPVSSRSVTFEQDLLIRNNQMAERNRGWFAGRNILALNLMSSPGAGKTTILERLLKDCSEETFNVIEGDQATLRDSERIHATGSAVVQVNTGVSCHLTAQSISAALRELNPPLKSIVVIENVGNLVCPALFDLGENARVVVASVPEGDDKPLKYPHMFRLADLILLNKIDLLPHVDFDIGQFEKYAREKNPHVEILRVSAKQEGGLDGFYSWLQRMKRQIL